LEGGEGVGKSTQLARLAECLRAQGKIVVTTREPGGTPGAEAIRDLLMTGSTDRWSARVEALLFAAARADHVERVIRPALDRGDWVLCDRFIDSTVAYQAGGRGLDRGLIEGANRLACGPVRPDLTILLDLDPSRGLGRASVRDQGQADRFEVLGAAFHRQVRDLYHTLVKEEPGRFFVVDAARPPEAIEEEIWHEIARRFR
jgi:dTMP kinase